MYSSLIPNAKIAMIQFGSSILNDVEATSTADFFACFAGGGGGVGFVPSTFPEVSPNALR